LVQVAFKCADLGHIAESREVHLRWVAALEEEFFRQGDAERAKGLPISPLFDRTKPGITKSQIGFFDVVALPLFGAFAEAFPGAERFLVAARDNLKYWRAQRG
jgi:cAMP-specific phosphodiesterase 4